MIPAHVAQSIYSRNEKMSKPTNFSIPESLEVVWEALHDYQDFADYDKEFEEKWDDITLAMAWITEALGYDIDKDGDYVKSEKEPMTGAELLATHTYKGQSALDLD